MDDLISRRDAIECLEHLSACNEPFVEIGTDDETFIGKYEAITQISDLPSAQPERKKGKWVNCYTDGFGNMCNCTECGARIDIQEKFRSFFCYHCGADMREDVLPSAQPTQCNSSNVLRHPQCANRTKLGNCDPVGGFCTSVSKEICDAQEHEKENITDTISRKAAIEAIFNEPLCESGMKERTAIAVVLAIYEKIKSLPSAQPEIIRCKDCKYGDTFHEFDDPEMPMKCIGHHYGGTYPDDFCSYAERKTYE